MVKKTVGFQDCVWRAQVSTYIFGLNNQSVQSVKSGKVVNPGTRIMAPDTTDIDIIDTLSIELFEIKTFG